MNRHEAQERADRIRAFAEELEIVEREGALRLEEAQRLSLSAYHERILGELAKAFDVDVTGEQKQLSWGMRIVAFLGAAAISAAVYFLFQRFWGHFPTAAQVAILVVAPLLAAAGVEVAARREETGYFASIAALVAFACFVLDLVLLGTIFNVTPSQNALLAWGAFALVLAYLYDLRLLLIAGILCLLGWLSATVGTWGGLYWLSTGERPENIVLGGAAIAALSAIPHRRHATFPGTWRLFGLLAVLIAILVLSNWGDFSVLPFSAKAVEHLYQAASFVVAGLVIWLGVRKHWPGTANLGSTFFAVSLYTRFYDWWWEWMPRYLFFLVVGLVAVLLLLVLKRLRAATQGVTP